MLFVRPVLTLGQAFWAVIGVTLVFLALGYALVRLMQWLTGKED